MRRNSCYASESARLGLILEAAARISLFFLSSPLSNTPQTAFWDPQEPVAGRFAPETKQRYRTSGRERLACSLDDIPRIMVMDIRMSAMHSWRRFFAASRRTALEPVTLGRNRIYILPTKAGTLYSALLLVMLLTSVNYNNPPGYLLTFLLAGVGFVSIFHTYRTLYGLQVGRAPAQPVFVGGRAVFQVVIRNPGPAHRHGVRVFWTRAGEGPLQDIPARAEQRFALSTPALERGKLAAGPITVASVFPLGLLRAWSPVRLDMTCIVYPRPESGGPAPPSLAGEHDKDLGQRSQSEKAGWDGDDFSGLRAYRFGDPPRQVAWKATARSEAMFAKEFASQEENAVIWLRWRDAVREDVEATLSRLCRWVLEADAGGKPYGLVIPGRRIEPAVGGEHLRQCLTALAVFEARPEET